jgi:hypothetical protein
MHFEKELLKYTLKGYALKSVTRPNGAWVSWFEFTEDPDYSTWRENGLFDKTMSEDTDKDKSRIGAIRKMVKYGY